MNRRSPDQFEAQYLTGKTLYGDDFVGEDLEAWFADESEGYATLDRPSVDTTYEYAELNKRHGFDHLSAGTFGNVLGFGSASGGEFLPYVDRIDRLTIVEPSRLLRVNAIDSLVPTYVDPSIDGRLAFDDGAFDLITCFGVLHHIPNVSAVLREMERCLAPHGSILVREPITSMGDWRYLRKPGVTRRERGLPLAWLRSTVTDLDLIIREETLCEFSLSTRLGRLVGKRPFNEPRLTRLDEVACRLTAWNSHRYHCTHTWQKVRPRSVFMVLSHKVHKPR